MSKNRYRSSVVLQDNTAEHPGLGIVKQLVWLLTANRAEESLNNPAHRSDLIAFQPEHGKINNPGGRSFELPITGQPRQSLTQRRKSETLAKMLRECVAEVSSSLRHQQFTDSI
ncbi:MAG TPA: hypothetical protein VFE51_25705 [Verrucomicrobiae bacterium]|nr:hypothetical protein [Verrucomicrobiae bacterium]